MNEKIIVSMKNLTDTEREQLMNLVKKASEEKKSKEWTPNYNENVYVINSCGGIVRWKYIALNMKTGTITIGSVRTEKGKKMTNDDKILIDKWQTFYSIQKMKELEPKHKRCINRALNRICEQLPVDAVHVVRCEDCKYKKVD